MKRYLFRCYSADRWAKATFHERCVDDAAAEARAMELSKGTGRPAPYIEIGFGERLLNTSKEWFSVEVWHNARTITWLSNYGEHDVWENFRLPDGTIDYDDLNNPPKIGDPI